VRTLWWRRRHSEGGLSLPSIPDLRPSLDAVYVQAREVAMAVTVEDLSRATPCSAMDVAALLDHLVFAARRAAALGDGEMLRGDEAPPHIELNRMPGVIDEAAANSRRAWASEDSMTREISMPWGEVYPGAALVAMYFVELSTHTWDVAASIDRTDLLDSELGSAALDCARASINPAFRNEQGMPFGPEIEPPPGATAWESLGAFMGRSPL
jgi:uncharacterized protein (TIGR03086 family)